jgi:uncharacterized membrane protein YphA (DoxX/SURF4 family)
MAERTTKKPSNLNPIQSLLLAVMRIAIGWHFAYEGVAKVLNPDWSAEGYLKSANWIGAEWFHWMASNEIVLWAVNLLNAWGLVLVGLGLMLGCMTRLAAIGGVAMLALYYAAHPALFADPAGPVEGSYLIVNKNLVEMFALLVVLVMPAPRWGIDGFLGGLFRRRARARVPGEAGAETTSPLPRRRMLAGLIGLPILGGFVLAVLKKRGYRSQEEIQLASHTTQIDGVTAPSMKRLSFETLDNLKGKVPTAKIKDLELSRVIMGGNLMNGFAHARDLIYVSNLVKAYHEDWRIFETLRLGEACGINAIITNTILAPQLVQYWEKENGKIKFVAQCKGKNRQDYLDNIQFAIDHDACAAYLQGMSADNYVDQGHFDWIAEGLQKMRDAGIPAGIGGHYLRTVQGCVDEGLEPDFWMKTLHHHNYWSSDTENQKDNVWCEKPEETIQFMESLPQPWIAFKVLAAGALHPRDGFRYAFENGADFICVGMYDFQVVEDCNIAFDVLEAKLDRKRPWRAVV